MEDKNIDGQLCEQLLDALKSKIEQYEMIIEYRTKGPILRWQSRCFKEGEKNTKYFLNLEKRRYKRGTISQLRRNNDNFIRKDTEILIVCLSYFKNLYTTKLSDRQDPSINQFFFPEVGDVHLLKAEETECLSSLKQMVDSKTPGTDGLPAEFYKLFWSDISDVLIPALNFAYDTHKLPFAQMRGLIKLIPKKETDLKNLKNWRPLSL